MATIEEKVKKLLEEYNSRLKDYDILIKAAKGDRDTVRKEKGQGSTELKLVQKDIGRLLDLRQRMYQTTVDLDSILYD